MSLRIVLENKKDRKNLKDIVIIDHSKYRSTKRYVQWIAETTGGDVFPLADFQVSQLEHYQTVVFGLFTHMGRIKAVDFLKKRWSVLRKKNLIVFATASTPSVGTRNHRKKSSPRSKRKDDLFSPTGGLIPIGNLTGKTGS